MPWQAIHSNMEILLAEDVEVQSVEVGHGSDISSNEKERCRNLVIEISPSNQMPRLLIRRQEVKAITGK